MRVLCLSTWFPYPPDNGSRIRAYHLVHALARDHQVTLVAFQAVEREPQGPWQHWVPENVEVYPVPVDPFRYVEVPTVVKFASPIPVACWPSRLMRDRVAQVLNGEVWDAVVTFQEPAARYALQVSDTARVLDVDVSSGYRRYEEFVESRGPLARARAWAGWQKAQWYERRLFRRFDACTVVMPEEARWIAASIDGCRVELSPNGVDCTHNRPSVVDERPNTLIYNGALTYSANYDAMQYFLAQVYPRIRGQVPNVSLTITGSLKGVDLSGLALDESVNLSGYVDDIRPLVAGSAVCVVPLRGGGGTRIKILEAMALGTPVVSTSKGAEGLHVADEEHLVLADGPAEFAACTVDLLSNGGLREHLASNARRLVEERYDWAQIGRRFVDVVEDVVAQREGVDR